MTEGADEKIRSAIKTLGSDPKALESLLSISGDARREKLREMGLGDISREEVQEFIEQDEVAGFAIRRAGGPGGPVQSTVEWAGVVATIAAGALAA
jgi:hypothetical protein